MVNYNLEEFKSWLEEDPSRKKGLDWESRCFRSWQLNNKSFENFVKAIIDPTGFLVLYPDGSYVMEIYRPYREVFSKWKTEVDAKRAREEAIEEISLMWSDWGWSNGKFSASGERKKVKTLQISEADYPDNITEGNNYSFYPKGLEGRLEIGGFSNLERLNLRTLKISEVGLTRTPKLKSIEVSGCPNLVTIEGLENCEQLTNFRVNDCPRAFNLLFQNKGQAIISYRSQLARADQQIEVKKNEVAQHLTKIQNLENQLTTKTNQLNQELEKTQQLQQNLTNLQTQKQTNENNLKQEIKNKETELQKTLTESKTSTANLRQEIDGLKKELQESKETSKKDLENEQNKLKDTEAKLTEQININQQKEQTISDLETNLKNSEKVLQETKETLSQSQQKVIQLETQILNHEQLKVNYEKNIEELSRELTETKENYQTSQQDNNNLKKELTQSQEKAQELNSNLSKIQQKLFTNQETEQRKNKELTKLRLEVVELKAKLKNIPKPEPKPVKSNETQPINPWILGTIMIVVIGGIWLTSRRKE